MHKWMFCFVVLVVIAVNVYVRSEDNKRQKYSIYVASVKAYH